MLGLTANGGDAAWAGAEQQRAPSRERRKAKQYIAFLRETAGKNTLPRAIGAGQAVGLLCGIRSASRP